MTAHTRLDPPLVESIRKALTGNSLPGETHGFSNEAESDAADWQLAMEALVAAAEHGGQVELAWAALDKALNRSKPPM